MVTFSPPYPGVMTVKKEPKPSWKMQDPQPHVTPKIPPFVSDFSHLSARYIPPPETQKEVLADRSISQQWAVSGNSRWPQEDSYVSMPFLEQKERSAPELRKGLGVEEDAALGASLCL